VVQNAQISLQNVRVPLDNRLANSHTFRDTEKVLMASRFAVAWEGLGAAVAGKATMPMVALAKMHNVRRAREILAARSRDCHQLVRGHHDRPVSART